MDRLMVSITHGKDDPPKAMVGFTIACGAAAKGIETVVYLSAQGVYLSQVGVGDDIHEEGLGPLSAIIGQVVDHGGSIWVCQSCFESRGLHLSMLVPGSRLARVPEVVDYLTSGATCISY